MKSSNRKPRLLRAGYSYSDCSFIDIAQDICRDFGLTLQELGKLPVDCFDEASNEVGSTGRRVKHFLRHEHICVVPEDELERPVDEVMFHADSKTLVLIYNSCVVIRER